MNPTQTEKENRIETADKPAERFAHTNQEKKRSENRRRASQYMKDLNRRNAISDMLYMVGFWVEYVGVCVRRKVSTVVRGIADTVLNLLLIVLRPILIGLITLIEDLAGPFVRIASGIRHIHELPAQLEDSGAGEVRAAKARYLASGIRKYSVLLWNAITYILPAVAAAALVVVVRGGLGLHFVLNVQVDGEHVGAVESEQVFENAREDVQSRINTAKRMLQAAGSDAADTNWDVYPTYTLAIGGQTMTESEIANAILRTASDEIINGTAVYVDDQLLYVTTEGDHLRTYLESIKAPFENDMDSSIRTGFVHDIRLLDGTQHVYLNGEDVSTAIRAENIGMAASAVAAHPAVRAFLLDTQRGLAESQNILMDGRDIGTVVLPNATVKIFLTATAEARAERRAKELAEKGQPADLATVLADIRQRDYQDSHRAVAPLKQAEDAILVDTSDIGLQESFDLLKRTILAHI